jgi:predicted HicB family RNase H-like nuclease
MTTKRITIAVPLEVHQKLTREAAKAKLSLNEYLNKILKESENDQS